MKKQQNILLYLFLLTILSIQTQYAQGQSIELMLGHKRLFADVQWLKFMDESRKWSIFSRTRAVVDYDNNTDLFSGAYLNYTTTSGIGGSLVGKIGNSGAGVDAGIHIFKAKPNWMLFGLASVGLKSDLEYSWFSIFRFTPPINEKWKFYSSIELFSLFAKNNHLLSVQRIRLGFDIQNFQFGLAGNFAELGTEWFGTSNMGIFIRKSF